MGVQLGSPFVFIWEVPSRANQSTHEPITAETHGVIEGGGGCNDRGTAETHEGRIHKIGTDQQDNTIGKQSRTTSFPRVQNKSLV